MNAWHFLRENGRLGYGDDRAPVDGEWIEADGELALCQNGMHAARRLIDALRYAPGPIACRVELGGEMFEGDDKLCARRRRILWRVDATEILHEFACRCAEDALALVDAPDPRSVAAIEAKRAWLCDEISDWDLTAARDAAWDAARDAARAAAEAAAWTAARGTARDAAWDAAWGAAEAAAWTAARGTARDAAWDAARAAAEAAAWTAARGTARAAAMDAAWDAQNRRLTAMISARKP